MLDKEYSWKRYFYHQCSRLWQNLHDLRS